MFAASVSHLIALVRLICESVCVASEWANISFESMWNFHACSSQKKKKSVDGSAINGRSEKSEGSVTHEKPWQRGLYRWRKFNSRLGIKMWSEIGCVWGFQALAWSTLTGWCVRCSFPAKYADWSLLRQIQRQSSPGGRNNLKCCVTEKKRKKTLGSKSR